jgi:glycosyltransferase involved in cell wall biosynthesis
LSKETAPYEESDGSRIFRIGLVSTKLLWLLSLRTRLENKFASSRLTKSVANLFRTRAEDTTSHEGSPAEKRVSKYYSLMSLIRKFLWQVYSLWYRIPRWIIQKLGLTYLLYLEYYLRSFRVARKEATDVYHAHDLITLPVAWLCSRVTGGKLVYDAHELWLEGIRGLKRSRLNRFLVQRLESFLIRRTDANIMAGVSSAELLSRMYHIPQLTVILNVPLYHTYERSTVLRDRLRIPAEEKILLFEGTIYVNRGIEECIQSLKYLSQCSLVMLGFGPDFYISDLKRLIEDEGLTHKVYFFGAVPHDEVTRTAMAADVGLVVLQNANLNYYYASPNKIFDFMAAGLPVVGSNFPDLKKFIEGYNMGVTCDPTSPREIADAINYILSDESRYNEMRKNALEAAKIFNWENESKKLLALYAGLSGKKEGIKPNSN